MDDDSDAGCPVEATLAVIGGKWKAVLIYHMMHGGTHRFAELRRKTPGISEGKRHMASPTRSV